MQQKSTRLKSWLLLGFQLLPWKSGAGPGNWAGSLTRSLGTGEGGDSTGLSLVLPAYLTEPTATARPSLIDTQAPEFFSDWRFR
jgi:hypothetical protein